jgi:hypothetical protein
MAIPLKTVTCCAREILDRSDDFGRMVGFPHGKAPRNRAGRYGGEPSSVDHRKIGIVLPASFRDLPAVDPAWQPDIDD